LDIIEELKEKTDNKAVISIDLNRIKIGPDHKNGGEEFYIYQLRNLEKIFADSVINKLDSLSSYKLYVNTDDIEDYKGNDTYCYNLFEVIQEFKQDIASAIQDLLHIDDAIETHIVRVYERYSKFIKEEMNDIGNYLLKEIDILLLNKD
jgi:hypothetical protein